MCLPALPLRGNTAPAANEAKNSVPRALERTMLTVGCCSRSHFAESDSRDPQASREWWTNDSAAGPIWMSGSSALLPYRQDSLAMAQETHKVIGRSSREGARSEVPARDMSLCDASFFVPIRTRSGVQLYAKKKLPMALYGALAKHDLFGPVYVKDG